MQLKYKANARRVIKIMEVSSLRQLPAQDRTTPASTLVSHNTRRAQAVVSPLV